uniref:Meiotic recombination protein REC114 n=3 Tax=Oryzias latipes TaxID=8090 RepID=A0A3P9IG89_ORYLA
MRRRTSAESESCACRLVMDERLPRNLRQSPFELVFIGLPMSVSMITDSPLLVSPMPLQLPPEVGDGRGFILMLFLRVSLSASSPSPIIDAFCPMCCGKLYSLLRMEECNLSIMTLRKTEPQIPGLSWKMSVSQTWNLKRYGRFIPCSGKNKKAQKPWKIFEDKNGKSKIFLTILESGHLLVTRGQESLETIPLLSGCDCLKVQQKSDNLMFQMTVKGVSRMLRMQFDGRDRAEAMSECSSAAEELKKYLSVTTLDDPAVHPNQPPADTPAPATQLIGEEKSLEADIMEGSLPIQHLAKHFLGKASLTLPQMHSHTRLAESDLEPLLRLCLLDPSFPAFVEKVEAQLQKLLEE